MYTRCRSQRTRCMSRHPLHSSRSTTGPSIGSCTAHQRLDSRHKLGRYRTPTNTHNRRRWGCSDRRPSRIGRRSLSPSCSSHRYQRTVLDTPSHLPVCMVGLRRSVVGMSQAPRSPRSERKSDRYRTVRIRNRNGPPVQRSPDTRSRWCRKNHRRHSRYWWDTAGPLQAARRTCRSRTPPIRRRTNKTPTRIRRSTRTRHLLPRIPRIRSRRSRPRSCKASPTRTPRRRATASTSRRSRRCRAVTRTRLKKSVGK